MCSVKLRRRKNPTNSDNPEHVAEIRQARNEAEKLRAELRHSAGDAEEHRRVVEKARGIRGRLAGVRDESADQVHELGRKLDKEVNSFNKECREDADESAVEEFDNLAKECRESLKRTAKAEFRMLGGCWSEWGKFVFPCCASNRLLPLWRLSISPKDAILPWTRGQFDEDVAKGLEAIENRDFDEVWGVIRRISEKPGANR